MKYVYYSIAIAFIIYTLLDFKKKPNDSAVNRYYNFKYYRIIIIIIFGIIAAIISFFVKKN
jgi:hypothetical protein